MKKLIALLLAAVLCLFLVACSGGGLSETGEPSADETKILTAFDGKSPKIPYDAFPDYLEVVEITTENWKDYFEVVYDEEWKSYGLVVGKGFCYDMVDLTMELKIIKEDSPINGQIIDPLTGALVTEYDNKEGLEYTTDDFACVAAQGELIIANIPEELWGTDNDKTVVYIGSNDGEQWWTQGREAGLANYLD